VANIRDGLSRGVEEMSFASDRNVYHQRHVYVIFILAILTGVFSGCGHREGITDRKILHDRLINLMITENLPFGKDGTALRTEIITAGKCHQGHDLRHPVPGCSAE